MVGAGCRGIGPGLPHVPSDASHGRRQDGADSGSCRAEIGLRIWSRHVTRMSPLGTLFGKTAGRTPPVKHKRTRFRQFIGPEFGLVEQRAFVVRPKDDGRGGANGVRPLLYHRQPGSRSVSTLENASFTKVSESGRTASCDPQSAPDPPRVSSYPLLAVEPIDRVALRDRHADAALPIDGFTQVDPSGARSLGLDADVVLLYVFTLHRPSP